MTKIVITAPRGKQDKVILAEGVKRDDIEVIGTIAPKGRDYIGTQICGVTVYDDLEAIIDDCDVVIDFSTVENSLNVLEICKKHKKALLMGTTGFTAEQDALFEAAGAEIPMLKSANTSFMVNVLKKLLEDAAKSLADLCQIEIVDIHDKDKLDAPSGTALELKECMMEAANLPADRIINHSLRIGDTPSTHTVYFGGMDERIEIHHEAYTGKCFGIGALEAAVFLGDKPAGNYSMKDVVEAKTNQ